MKQLAIIIAVIAIGGSIWLFKQAQTPTAPAQVVASAPAAAPAATAAPHKMTSDSTRPKPYPFSTSVVTGDKLPAKDGLITFTQDGYEIKAASTSEADAFKKTPDVYLAKIKQAYQDAKPYPLKTCVVMGDDLDDTAYVFVYEGRQFKLCCDGCLDDFQSNPAKYEKIWDDATAAAQKKP
jgi:YHS domain-containing protein